MFELNTTFSLISNLLLALLAFIPYQLCSQSPRYLLRQNGGRWLYADHNLVANRQHVVAHRGGSTNPSLVANHRDALVSAPAARSFIRCRVFYVSTHHQLLFPAEHFRLERATNFYSLPSILVQIYIRTFIFATNSF